MTRHTPATEGTQTTLCPWCFDTFHTPSQWEDHFDKEHPVVDFFGGFLPLNTP